MKELAEFRETAQKLFDFLVTEFGFELEESAEMGAESYLRFRKDGDAMITVNYEIGGEPWVAINFPKEGSRTSLETLAKKHSIGWPKPLGESIYAVLERDAAALRDWCGLRYSGLI